VSGVDVVIPCYNYARFLPSAVQSALDQKGVDVRVLVIDDASPDNTSEVGEALARRDSRVTFRRHVVNCGHIASYNEGLMEWAAAEYSLMLSADDMAAPGAFARAAASMDRRPEVGMTYGMALVVSDDRMAATTAVDQSSDYRVVSSREFLQYCFEYGNAVETPTAIVRTSVQQRVGGYRPELPHSGDMEMWMRFAVDGPVVVFRAVQGFVRRHGSNMSDAYYGQQLRDRREIVHACESAVDGQDDRFPEMAAWRTAMRRRIGYEACLDASRAFDRGALDDCDACLRFAAEIWPDAAQSPLWRRIATKKWLGPTAWRAIRPAWARLRGSEPDLFAMPAPPPTPRVSGWWPNAR
jgi:glycosyltransferase involved in cell wall biosynthesis